MGRSIVSAWGTTTSLFVHLLMASALPFSSLSFLVSACGDLGRAAGLNGQCGACTGAAGGTASGNTPCTGEHSTTRSSFVFFFIREVMTDGRDCARAQAFS